MFQLPASRLGGKSLRMDEPERRVTGVSPAYAAKCPRRSEDSAHNVNQEIRGGPLDADFWQPGQDRMKRVSENEPLKFLRCLVALDTQLRQLLRQAWQYDGGILSPQGNGSLRRERLENFCGPGLPHTRSHFDEPFCQLLLRQCSRLCGRGVALEPIQHRLMIPVSSSNELQCRVDLCQQASDAIAYLSDLPGQIHVKAARHREFCQLAVSQLRRAKRMRQAAGSLSDNVGIPNVSLGFACVQVGNMPNCQSRQIGYKDAFVTPHCNRKCADSRRLIHYDQNRFMQFELVEQRSQLASLLSNALSRSRLPMRSAATV